jgi:hypothetical protein
VLNMMMMCRRSLVLELHCGVYDDVDVQEGPVAGAA